MHLTSRGREGLRLAGVRTALMCLFLARRAVDSKSYKWGTECPHDTGSLNHSSHPIDLRISAIASVIAAAIPVAQVCLFGSRAKSSSKCPVSTT